MSPIPFRLPFLDFGLMFRSYFSFSLYLLFHDEYISFLSLLFLSHFSFCLHRVSAVDSSSSFRLRVFCSHTSSTCRVFPVSIAKYLLPSSSSDPNGIDGFLIPFRRCVVFWPLVPFLDLVPVYAIVSDLGSLVLVSHHWYAAICHAKVGMKHNFDDAFTPVKGNNPPGNNCQGCFLLGELCPG